MAETKKYPYIASKKYKGQDYVVLFSEENYGTVIMSNIKKIPELGFGAIGEYDESTFEVLPDDKLIFVTNGTVPENVEIKVSLVPKDEN